MTLTGSLLGRDRFSPGLADPAQSPPEVCSSKSLPGARLTTFVYRSTLLSAHATSKRRVEVIMLCAGLVLLRRPGCAWRDGSGTSGAGEPGGVAADGIKLASAAAIPLTATDLSSQATSLGQTNLSPGGLRRPELARPSLGQSVLKAMSRQSALSTDGTALVLNDTEPGKTLGATAPGLITGLQGASRNLDQGEENHD